MSQNNGQQSTDLLWHKHFMRIVKWNEEMQLVEQYIWNLYLHDMSIISAFFIEFKILLKFHL